LIEHPVLGVGVRGSGEGICTAALVVNLDEKKPSVYEIPLRPLESLFTVN